MWLGNVGVAVEIVLPELLGWYDSICAKYGYHGDNQNLSSMRKLKMLYYSFIPVERHLSNVLSDES